MFLKIETIMSLKLKGIILSNLKLGSVVESSKGIWPKKVSNGL